MKVVSNIKGGVNCELSQKTLILGASGSGKSAIVNAIELAVSRRLGDLLAREDVSRKDLLACYTADGAPPTSSVTPLDPGACLPFRDLKEAVRGSPETFWRFVLRLPKDEARSKQLKHSKDRLEEASSALEYVGRIKFAEKEKLISMIRADIASRELEIKALESSLESDAQKLPELAHTRALSWASAAQKFIPQALGELQLCATSAARLDLKIGLLRTPGPIRYALSGAEFNIVLTALAITLNDAPSCIVIPDDRAISSVTLTNWLGRLAAAKCSVILTSVARPKSVPAGFRVLELGKTAA